MPVSWEMASGPTVAYKMAGQGSTCTVEGSKSSNFSNFRVQDVLAKGFSNTGEANKGSTHRLPSSNDAVVRGLSALSLCGKFEADCTAEERGSTSLGALHCGSPDLYRCVSPGNNESSSFAVEPPCVCNKPFDSEDLACSVDFIQHNGMHNQASTFKNVSGGLLQLDGPHAVTLKTTLSVSNYLGIVEGFQQDCAHRNYDTSWISNVHGNNHEQDGDLDLMSESSVSTQESFLAGSSSSGEALQVTDETEAQSVFKEAADLSCSVGTSFSPRKGLSQFYAGKSRSFSYLGEVSSVKDLAKPESPHHVKKRRVTSVSARLPPLQRGSVGICKKQLQNGKSTLALAVAMSTKEEGKLLSQLVTSRSEKSLMQSRSYSLSDLQRASGSLFFIG